MILLRIIADVDGSEIIFIKRKKKKKRNNHADYNITQGVYIMRVMSGR